MVGFILWRDVGHGGMYAMVECILYEMYTMQDVCYGGVYFMVGCMLRLAVCYMVGCMHWWDLFYCRMYFSGMYAMVQCKLGWEVRHGGMYAMVDCSC